MTDSSILTPWFGTPLEKTAADTSSAVPYPTVPGGILNNDRIIIWGVSGSNNNTGFSTPTTGTSWTQLDQHAGTADTAAPAMAIFRRRATGGESGTVTCPHGNIITTMGCIIIRGVDATTPLDVAAVPWDKTAVDRVVAFTPPNDIVTRGALGLYISTANSTTLAYSPITGWTEPAGVGDRDTGLSGNRSFGIAYKEQIPPGALGAQSNSTGLSTSAKAIGCALFFRPATPGSVEVDTGTYRLDAGPTRKIVAITPF